MKKPFVQLVCICSLALLFACGGSGGDTPPSQPDPQPDPPPPVNQPPIFNGVDDFNVLEGTQFVGEIIASDADSDTLEFEAVGGDDITRFELTKEGRLSFLETTDFELPADNNGDNQYTLEISVTDGQDSAQRLYTIRVNNALEGIVIDGPMSGALVFNDLNTDYIQNNGESSANTRVDGFFSLADQSDSQTRFPVVSIGGRDTQTGNELANYVLLASVPSDTTQFLTITPLASLLSTTDDNALQQQALANLNLSSSVDTVLYTNHWAALETGDVNAQNIQKVNQQLSILLQIVVVLSEDSATTSPGKVSATLFSTLFSQIIAETGPLSLTASEEINALLASTISGLAVEMPITETELMAVANAVASALAVLDDESVLPHLSDATQLLDIIQTTFLSQITALVNNEMGLSEFEAATEIATLFASWDFSDNIVDTDGDQLPDLIDPDDDNDGVVDEEDAFPTDPTRWAEESVISIVAIQPIAIESTGSAALVEITRTTEDLSPLDVNYAITGNPNPALGSVSPNDYAILYANETSLGNVIQFTENETVITLKIIPTADSEREVPETLAFSLVAGDSYDLAETSMAELTLIEANSNEENRQLFLGTFEPQDGADTQASGLLTFLLEGDNSSGRLTYTYTNLGTQRTDQHMHLWPSGTIVHDIKDEDLESNGNVSDYVWDLSPGGVFTNKQQMLDALFNGEFYINVHSADFPNGEISAHLIYDAVAEPPDQGDLTADEVDADIIRFLNQATFGATPEDYASLRSVIDTDGNNRLQAYELWIDEQFATPTTSLLSINDHVNSVFAGQERRRTRASGFWTIALHGKDQLRHRMAFALSEILVVSSLDSSLNKLPRGVESYWDMLAENAFGTYQQLLLDTARHPAMGVYLSHLRNSKAAPELGYFPDENFAREIMQLFSFGLVKRNNDGSIILGENNLPIATYDNTVIKEMARVFTGLGLAYTQVVEGENVDNTSFTRAQCGDDETDHYCWTQPMKFFPDYHDFGEKTLFSDGGTPLVIPANADTSAVQAETELQSVIDAIVAHSSTAPFIARRLIQRLVTSNPSPGYIERVALAFGNTGDMKATVKAILLDPEARAPSVISSTTFGKFKEPILHLTALTRLLSLQSMLGLGEGDEQAGIIGTDYIEADKFNSDATLTSTYHLETVTGQDVLRAPSVFNFFSPDFTPTGELSSMGLVAPELKLVTESQVYATFNAYNQIISAGLVANPSPFTYLQAVSQLDYGILAQVWSSSANDDLARATELVDFMDFYLNASKLKLNDNQSTRLELIEAIVNASCDSQEDCERYHLAIYGALTAPEFQIQQ